jgi:hypothetical protein
MPLQVRIGHLIVAAVAAVVREAAKRFLGGRTAQANDADDLHAQIDAQPPTAHKRSCTTVTLSSGTP